MLQVVKALLSLCLLLYPAQGFGHSFYWGGQRTVVEIKRTASLYGASFGNPTTIINAQCPGFRFCSMSDIYAAYANRATGWDTWGGTSAWVQGYDISGIRDYDLISPVPTTTNCNNWTSTNAADYAIVFSVASNHSLDFSLAACSVTRPLLCCR